MKRRRGYADAGTADATAVADATTAGGATAPATAVTLLPPEPAARIRMASLKPGGHPAAITARHLVRVDPPNPIRHCALRVDGDTLVTTTWSDGGRPRTRVEGPFEGTLAGSVAARRLIATANRKMLEGYVYLGARPIAPWELVFEMVAPANWDLGKADLRPDGGALVVPGEVLEEGSKCVARVEIHGVDLTTGRADCLLAIPRPPGVTRYDDPRIDNLWFDADGDALFVHLAIDSGYELRRAALGTGGVTETIAQARFQHSVQQGPRRDCFVAFSESEPERVRVLDTAANLVHEIVHDVSDGLAWKKVALSPAGDRLAVYAVSRWLAGTSPTQDLTHEYQLWDLATSRLVRRIPRPMEIPEDKLWHWLLWKGDIAFSADGTEVLQVDTHPPRVGARDAALAACNVDTGTKRVFPGYVEGEWAVALSQPWLAVGRDLVDARSFTSFATAAHQRTPGRVVFSQDGRTVVMVGQRGKGGVPADWRRITVWSTPQVRADIDVECPSVA